MLVFLVQGYSGSLKEFDKDFMLNNLTTGSLVFEILLIISISIASYYALEKSNFGSNFNNLFTGSQEKYISGKQYFIKSILILVSSIIIYSLFSERGLIFAILENILIGFFLLLRYNRLRDLYGIDKNYYLELQNQAKKVGRKNIKVDKNYSNFIKIWLITSAIDFIVFEAIIFYGLNLNYSLFFLIPGIILQIFLTFKRKINK